MRRAGNVDTVAEALFTTGGLDSASKKLGVSVATLCRRIKEFNLDGYRDGRLYGLIGSEFGDWTIDAIVPGSKRKPRRAICTCECGNTSEVVLNSVTSGKSTGCGCRKTRGLISRSTKHGLVRVPEYSIWTGMKARCLNPLATNYCYYGALGISVCEKWRKDFGAFYEDMGPRPPEKHSIERVDVFGNYEPSNCRWATQSEQMRNQRRQRCA